jgi:hypothetical protein
VTHRLARFPLHVLPLLLLMTGCEVCSPVQVVFPNPDDDDTTEPADDDDSTDPPVEQPPELVIDLVEPSVEELIAGTVSVEFRVWDEDSDVVTVSVSYSIDGVDGAWSHASLEDGGSEVVIEGSPGLPLDAAAGHAGWDTTVDIPASSGDAALRLCPTDAEGNEGSCVDLAPLVVVNEATSWPGAFCQPGHVEGMDWVAGQALVPLSDGGCLNVQINDPPQPDDFAARFMLVLVNPHAEDVGFKIAPNANLDPDGAAPAPGPDEEPEIPPLQPAPMGECTPDLGPEDLNGDPRAFYLRTSLDSTDREARPATLRALGEHVAVYVDEETPLDVDLDCADPDNAVIPDDNPAFGFDNCDLQGVVDVFEMNIQPTLTTTFGEPSDVDLDCRVTVFVSHRINKLTREDADPTNDHFTVKAFAAPGTDLWQSDLTLNPNSNQREIVYLYAPDPAPLWSDEPVPVDRYLDYELAGQMARAMTDLISYAAHRQVGDRLLDPADPEDLDNPPADEDWLADAMGLLAADLAGFGSIAFQDAWIYLDRPHLLSLLAPNTDGDFQDRGGQYLFARYLLDVFGVEAAAAIVGAQTNGTQSVEAATGMPFDELALQWATAMAASGRLDSAGGQLVPDSAVPNFTISSTVVVPASPVPGDLVGAQGFQQGFNLRGQNRTFLGGSDVDGPTELEEARVLSANLDPLVFHPQADFFGHVSGGYGVVAVLVAGLEQPVNHLLIETASGQNLLGQLFRIDDESPHDPSLALEDVDGALLTTLRQLGEIPIDGDERRVLGRIDPWELIDVAMSTPLLEPGTPLTLDDAVVPDTDRFAFSLSAVTTIGVQMERRFSDLSGGAALADPFAAIVPAGDLPDAWDYGQWGTGPSPADGPCWNPDRYDYPVIVPDFVAAQGILADDPTVDWTWDPIVSWQPEDVAGDDDDDAADGLPLPPYDCVVDLDQDDVPDEFEAWPTTLHAQVVQRQAQHLAIDPTWYLEPWSQMPAFAEVDLSQPFFGASFFDLDSNEVPDDDLATALPAMNLGGRTAKGGEEAVWFGALPPGDYVLVVGGVGGSAGPYDLSVRAITGP